MKKIVLLIVSSLLNCVLFSQKSSILDQLIVRLDTQMYIYKQHKKNIQGRDVLPVMYRSPEETLVIEIQKDKGLSIDTAFIEPSVHYQIIWQRFQSDKHLYSAHIKISDIHRTSAFPVIISYTQNGHKKTEEFNLFPYVQMSFNVRQKSDEIYVGEEALLELNTNFPENVLPVEDWQEGEVAQYRIIRQDNRWYIQIIPLVVGRHQVNFRVPIHKPIIVEESFRYYKDISLMINVRSSQLFYIQIDPKEFVFDPVNRTEPLRAEIDFHRNLKKNKTYRIENTESRGTLIAEIVPKRQISSKRMECDIYLYNIHLQQRGLLYLKDGDEPLFTTNFSVLPAVSVQQVEISRDGVNWIRNLVVFPGEKVYVRILGTSLHKGLLHFGNVSQRFVDTISITENRIEYLLSIPEHITLREIPILIANKATPYKILIREYQKPRPLDFISIDYGEGFRPLLTLSSTIFFEKILKDVLVQANTDMLDDKNQFYGKQYLLIIIDIYGSRGELLEKLTIQDICFCPSPKSSRYHFYDKKDCSPKVIRMNDYLRKKTYTLDRWSKVVITIMHDREKYEESGFSRSFEIILHQSIRVDVDVSFPAGLLVLTPGQDRITNFSGISMAMLAQTSFYRQNAFARMHPFKIGAGFLALNSFNFSDNPNILRDMCIVGLISFFPVSRESKMNFPLYAGGGYFLSEKRFFWLLGPGIRVSF